MRAYLEAEGVSFDLRTVTDKGRKLAPWSTSAESEAKERIRKHLKVYEGPLNDAGRKAPGTKRQPLGKNWFTNAGTETIHGLRRATTNYFRWFTRNNVDTRYFAWTSFKNQRKALVGKGYKHHTQWMALNIKATNEYTTTQPQGLPMTTRSTRLDGGDMFATQTVRGVVIETTTQQWPNGVTVEVVKRSDGLTIETVRDAKGAVVRSTEHRHAPAL
jgi:hypothetical protein